MAERLDTLPRRRRLALTPLIDVIFLLLLFFMLTSTFARQGELPLHLATGSGAGAEADPPAFVQLGAGGLRLDTEAMSQEGLRAALQARGEGLVLLALDDEVRAQELAEVLHLLQGLAGWRLAVLGGVP